MVNFSTKIASTVSMVTLTVTALGATAVSAASEFLPYAELLVDNSVINAQSTEAGYRLGDTVTRAELAKVAANLGGYTPTSCTGVYADVGASLGDLCGYIEALNEAGVVASATNFRPLASVTRAEMVKMLLGVVGETGSTTSAGYMDVAGLGDLTGFINRAHEMGCAATATYFRPNATSTRGESFKIAACAAGLEPVTPPTTGSGGTGITTTTGAVTVALDGTAVAQYVPYNASSVKVGSVKLTATSDTTVSSVVVTRSGLGNVAGISSLQLAQNGVAVSDTRSMSSSSQTATLRFTNPLVLKAGQSTSFDVLVNLNGSSTDYQNNQHQFTVTAVNVVSGTATGTPVTLGLLNTTSYSVGTVTVNSVTAGTVTSGKVNQTVATVNIAANRDATLNGFTLTRSSGEDFTKVLANAKAYYNGSAIGTVTVTTDKIVVTGLNIARLSGESASIEIRADGVYVGPGANVVFNIAQSTDVSATEKATGYIMGVTGASPSASATLTLGALDITLTKVSTGSKTVAPGTSGVELYNATIKSDASFDVSNFTITLTGAANLNNFSDNQVTVYIAGTDYIMDTTTKTFSNSSDAFRVDPGTPVTVRVIGNVKSTATVPTVYNVTLTLNQAKNTSNGQYVTLVGKTLQGDSITVSNGTFTVEKPSTIPTNKTVAEGSQSDVLYFNVRAAAEDQVLKSLTVTSGTGTFESYATKVALMQGTTELKSITSSTDLNNTSFQFTDINNTLKKDVTTPFTVRVTLKSGEVTTLGKNVVLSVNGFNVVRSVDQTKPTTTTSVLPINGNTYQVSSTTPVVSLPSQVGVDTELTIANTSPYDVVVENVTATVTQNSVNGNYLQWTSSPVTFLDAINGSSVGAVSGNAPGAISITPTALTVGTASVSRFLEIQNNVQTITDADYTVTVKTITYHYVDRTDSLKVSPAITESISGVAR